MFITSAASPIFLLATSLVVSALPSHHHETLASPLAIVKMSKKPSSLSKMARIHNGKRHTLKKYFGRAEGGRTSLKTNAPKQLASCHSQCSTGAALSSSCGSCVAEINNADYYCQYVEWDSVCVGEVASVCGISCSAPVTTTTTVAKTTTTTKAKTTTTTAAVTTTTTTKAASTTTTTAKKTTTTTAKKTTTTASGSAPSNAPLTDEQDELYIVPVTLGNGQAFTMDLDTGSSDTWFRGSSCTSSDGSCGASGQASVNTADSTLSSLGSSFSTSYGSGSISGSIYTGPVSLAGLSATFQIGVSNTETGFSSPGDGLFGLGFNSISQIASVTGGNANYIDSLNLPAARNQFAFYMSNSANGDNGEVSLGGVDSSKFTGTPVYVPLTSQTYWEFDFSGATFSAGGKSGAAVGATTGAICDTGTTLVILDTAPADAINKAIGASAYDSTQGAYPIACSIATTGPTVQFAFGGGSFPVGPAEYVLNVGTNTCISGFTQGAASASVVILGDVFIRNNYAIFDKSGSGRVGFAPAVHP